MVESGAATAFSILVIEDDGGLNVLIQKLLQSAGITASGANSGGDALGKLSESTYDLLLVDYRLPDMTGEALIRELLEMQPDAAFIVMSGHGEVTVAVDLMKLGARDYLVKDGNFLDALPTVVARARRHIEVERRLKESQRALRESEAKHRTIYENIQDVYYEIDLDGIVLEMSPSVMAVLGYDRQELIGKSFFDVFASPEQQREFLQLIRERGTLADYEFILLGKISPRPCALTSKLIAGEDGIAPRIIGTIRDIHLRKEAEGLLKASLREKEVLLKEIHHRVKNNMQVISSLLSLQAAEIEDNKTRELFMESQNRVKSMALIHEKLYHSETLSRVDFGEYVRDLSASLVRTYASSNVSLAVMAADIFLGVDIAIPCGLIVNELVSNSLKHAFPDGRAGTISIDCQFTTADECTLCVTDNGIGFPKNFDFASTRSLGLTLVQTLSKQLHGVLTIDSTGGTAFTIRFPRARVGK
ncbi:MAG: response regulator [Ignavibacteriales bacterium]|nr:response regulator [Ignavibacteriales bacterium]